MAKKDASMVGQNVRSYQEGTILWFGVDLSESGPQTEGSKGLDKKGKQKRPNEMVATTRAFTSVGEGQLLLHYIRPMDVQQVRKQRALAEIDAEDEDASIAAAVELLKSKGLVK